MAAALFSVTPPPRAPFRIERREVAITSPGIAMRDRMVRRIFVRQSGVNSMCSDMQSTLRIKTSNMEERIENLSGANRQKVLIARRLLTNPSILIPA